MKTEPTRHRPPRLAAWLLRKTTADVTGTKCGDFEEEYRENMLEIGKMRAYLIYWKQLIKSIPGFLDFSIMRSGAMIKSYFKI